MTEAKEVLKLAQYHVDQNLVEGCKELIELHDTGILKDGVVRQTIEILKPLGEFNALTVAQKLYEYAAMEIVANS